MVVVAVVATRQKKKTNNPETKTKPNQPNKQTKKQRAQTTDL